MKSKVSSSKRFSPKEALILIAIFALIGGVTLFLTKASGVGDSIISADFNNSPIVIKTSDNFSGAIYSLTWNNQEFVKQTNDNQKLMQSSVSYSTNNGCLNSIEAGLKSEDSSKPTNVESLYYSANSLVSKAVMSHWQPKGDESQPYCDNQLATTEKVPDSSSTKLNKKVVIGYSQMPNVIEYTSWYNIAQNLESAVFEPISINMPASYNKFFSVDKSGQLNDIGFGKGYDSKYTQDYDLVKDQLVSEPVIFANNDGSSALGIYSYEQQSRFNGPGYGDWDYGIKALGYGRWNYDFDPKDPYIKLNLLYRSGLLPAGDYGFRNFVVVGDLNQVKDSITKLEVMQKNSISRAEATKKVVEEFSVKSSKTQTINFKDVSPISPFFTNINTLVYSQIMSGCSLAPSLFCPDRLLTRAESSEILLKASQLKPDPEDLKPLFIDVPTSHPNYQYIQKLGRLNITIGCGVNPARYCPDEPISANDFQTLIDRIKL